MSLALEILNGPEKGRIIPLQQGQTTVGRKNADIILNDKKVSSFHAVIKYHPDLQKWYLEDQGSANGVIVDDEQVGSVPLLKGTELTVGNTKLRVVELAGLNTKTSAHQMPSESKSGKSSSREELALWMLSQSVDADKSSPQGATTPFAAIVRLQFTRGPQLNTIWEMGYGPRKVGSKVLEFPVFDSEAPAIAFYLRPDGSGKCVYSTPKPQQVLLNGQPVVEKQLSVGDKIQIQQVTLIEVIACP